MFGFDPALLHHHRLSRYGSPHVKGTRATQVVHEDISLAMDSPSLVASAGGSLPGCQSSCCVSGM